MNIRFMRTFCSVAEKGSMAAAARALGLANASVAEQIRALEQELGTALTLRRGQTVALTDAGQAVLPTMRSIVAQAEDLSLIAQAGALRGRLRVGSISTVLTSLIPDTLRRLALLHPEIDLKVVPGTSMGLLALLEAEEIDCALSVKPPFSLPKSLSWQPVRAEPLVLVAPDDLSKQTIAASIRSAPFIRMDRNAWTGMIVNRYLLSRRIPVRELFELDAPETIVALVAEGLGVSLLPDWGIVSPPGGKLAIRPVKDQRFDREIGLIGRRSAASTLIGAFASVLMGRSEA
ncbi:LysR substrate-binding domain-containing protein [Rhizobium sp. NPDC090279]|uniref:LysR substrate-binding domain-containing protein n=1 Tax=Rhizobium sp. NPDC090279 TaxID=3364499 RepID=UPI003839D34E